MRISREALLALCACLPSACSNSEFDGGYALSVGDEAESTDDGDSDETSTEGPQDSGEVEPGRAPEPLDSTDDSTDSTDSGDTGGSGACEEFSDVLAPVPPSVLFLLDRSGSMMQVGFDPEHPEKTRWQSLHEAVTEVLLADDIQTHVEFGAKTFSSKGWGECGVSPQLDVALELGNSELLLATIPGPLMAVNGGTPTVEALAVGLDHMRGYPAEGSKVVVLVTDGAIGCTADPAVALEQAVSNIGSAHEVDGIATYVVGIAPGFGSAKAQLEALAIAGGSDDYFEADNAEALIAALDAVVAASYANSCLLEFAEAPSDPELTLVESGGQSWSEVESCASDDGWVWENDALTRIRLCNAACDALLETQAASVEFHCNPG